jgi:hypothetical protein
METMPSLEEPSSDSRLAGAFRRLGWIGFWLQLAIGCVPLALLVYAILLGGNDGIGTRGRFALIDYLTIGSLLVLAFTTVWSYRYTRRASRITEPDRRPPTSSIQRIAWIGVGASAIGIVFSALVMMFEVTQILLYFLRAPQAGVPVIQTTGGGPASWVSTSDVLSLMGLIVTMLAEIVVLTISLWLLFLATMNAADSQAAHESRTVAEA